MWPIRTPKPHHYSYEPTCQRTAQNDFLAEASSTVAGHRRESGVRNSVHAMTRCCWHRRRDITQGRVQRRKAPFSGMFHILLSKLLVSFYNKLCVFISIVPQGFVTAVLRAKNELLSWARYEEKYYSLPLNYITSNIQFSLKWTSVHFFFLQISACTVHCEEDFS